jgi:hypothetical protein
MVASMLRQLGLFLGNDLENNSESMFFIKHNDWILRQSGAAWDNPGPIQWFFQNDQLVRLAETYIRERIRGLPVIKYLGWKRFFTGQRLLSGIKQPWGWKDPRTTFTLPLWLRLFPDARVVHIFRNGVSVAASLRARERRHLSGAETTHEKRRALGLYNFVPKQGGFVWSERCLSLEGGFSLWEEYVGAAMKIIDEIAPRALTFRYESFLENPVNSLTEIAGYCGLAQSMGEIRKIASAVNPERAND